MGPAVIEDDPLLRKELDRLQAQLLERFSPPVRPEDVERCLHSCMAMFESARVRTYLMLLIERATTDRLRAEVQMIESNERSSARPDSRQRTCNRRGLIAAVDLELPIDDTEVEFQGVHGDVQLLGDFAESEPAG